MRIALYLTAVLAVLSSEHACRVFWTCAIAALPLLWVAIGFHAWRRVCPLAAFARLPARLGREGKRRAPHRLARLAPLLQLATMLLALLLRHAAINGDPAALAGFLLALALAALLVGLRWSGRTWCNLVCPVGLVERLYAGIAPPRGTSSRCAPCTACVRDCSDIDLLRAHRRTLLERPRALAAFAWPGVVLGFYLAFLAGGGGWDAYFSGCWAYRPAWSAAITLVLIGCGGASALLFAAIERSALILGADPRLLRHRLLVGAGALGFATFYLFAGQPTLLLLPAWARATVGIACALGAAAIVARGLRVEPRETRPLPIAK